jgi:hypothetical protein
VRTDGTGLERVFGDATFDARRPDVSSDGRWITFASAADPLGSNPEGNTELFAYDTLSASLSQVTSFTEGAAGGGRIAGNGPWVSFSTSAPVFEDDPDRPSDLYRIRLDGTGIERVGARRAGFAVGIGPVSFGGGASLQPDDGGVRSALSGIGDLTTGNLDLLPEIWAIDRSTAAVLRVSGAAPTALTWDYEPGPLRYDAIRGDLAALATGAGTVDLGAVVCLEDDSPDAGTAGFEDPEDPAPGEGFFYMYRGSAGLSAGPGSYGASSEGLERSAGAGDCTAAP